MILWVIQNASDQKTEMEKIKGKMAQEVSKIEERKAKIDDELKEVQVSCQTDLSSQYDITCQLLEISIHNPSLYLFHTCYPSCTDPFFTSVSPYHCCPLAFGRWGKACSWKHQAWSSVWDPLPPHAPWCHQRHPGGSTKIDGHLRHLLGQHEEVRGEDVGGLHKRIDRWKAENNDG